MRAIAIALGVDSFASSLGNRLDVARTPALIHVDPESGPVLGRGAITAGKSGSGSLFRDFTTRVGDPVPLIGAHVNRTGAQLVAAAVRALVRDRLPGRDVEVVLAHPVTWSEYARADLSMELAQLGIRHTLVTAAEAAFTALAAAHELDPAAGAMICDVGRSGTEVSFARPMAAGSARPGVTVAGATRLDDFGGDLVDYLLMRWVLTMRPDIDTDDPDNQPWFRALRVQARIAKEQLSRDVAATIGVNVDGEVEDQRIVRAELEELIDEPVQRLALRVADLVGQAEQPPAAIALIGGGSAVPLVAERLSAALRLPIVTSPEPADVVVRGAVALAQRVAPAAAASGEPPHNCELDRPLVDAGPPVSTFPAIGSATPRRRKGLWRGVADRDITDAAG
jgi:molecular chaperone DnaK (HSP70)